MTLVASQTRARSSRRAVDALLGAGVVGLSLLIGLGFEDPDVRRATVVPALAVGAVALALLAVRWFEMFLLALLCTRAAVDGVRLGFGIDPASVLAVIFLVAALLWLAAQRRSRGAQVVQPLHVALGALMAAALASSIGARQPGASLLETGRVGAAVVMFFVLTRFLNDRWRLRHVLAAMFASAAIPIVTGLAGALAGAGVWERKGDFLRLTATFAQSNTFARYLMLIIITGVAVYRYVSGPSRVALAVLLASAAICLVLTYTVGAWLATIAGLLVVAAVNERKLGLALVVAVVAAVVMVPGIGDRIEQSGLADDASSEQPTSLTWRLSFWGDVVHLADSNPITGIGLSGTELVTVRGKQAHNDFLRSYVEMGVVGLAAYLGLVAALVACARGVLRRARDGLDRGLAVALVGCTAAFVLASLAANVFRSVALLWYLLALAALAINAGRLAEAGRL